MISAAKIRRPEVTLWSRGKTAATNIRMPRHAKKSKSSAVHADVDLPRPVDQNAAAVAALGPHPTRHMGVPEPKGPQRGQQATSLPGQVQVIHDVMKPGRGIHGVPGIISSTSLGPEQRHRLVEGIIVTAMGGKAAAEGPVTKIAGRDSTAYNTGMVHLAGSQFK